MMPHAGGQYVYLREAYGPLWGFLYGWTSFAIIQTGTIAAVGVAFAKFFGVLVPHLGTGPEAKVLFELHDLHWQIALPLPWLAEPLVVFKRTDFAVTAAHLVAVIVIVGLTWWNTRGLTGGKWVQNIFTVAKIGSLLALVLIGLTVTTDHAIRSANYADPFGGIQKTEQFTKTAALVSSAPSMVIALMVMGGAMVGAPFSADAWNNVTFTAGEVLAARSGRCR